MQPPPWHGSLPVPHYEYGRIEGFRKHSQVGTSLRCYHEPPSDPCVTKHLLSSSWTDCPPGTPTELLLLCFVPSDAHADFICRVIMPFQIHGPGYRNESIIYISTVHMWSWDRCTVRERTATGWYHARRFDYTHACSIVLLRSWHVDRQTFERDRGDRFCSNSPPGPLARMATPSRWWPILGPGGTPWTLSAKGKRWRSEPCY